MGIIRIQGFMSVEEKHETTASPYYRGDCLTKKKKNTQTIGPTLIFYQTYRRIPCTKTIGPYVIKNVGSIPTNYTRLATQDPIPPPIKTYANIGDWHVLVFYIYRFSCYGLCDMLRFLAAIKPSSDGSKVHCRLPDFVVVPQHQVTSLQPSNNLVLVLLLTFLLLVNIWLVNFIVGNKFGDYNLEIEECIMQHFRKQYKEPVTRTPIDFRIISKKNQ